MFDKQVENEKLLTFRFWLKSLFCKKLEDAVDDHMSTNHNSLKIATLVCARLCMVYGLKFLRSSMCQTALSSKCIVTEKTPSQILPNEAHHMRTYYQQLENCNASTQVILSYVLACSFLLGVPQFVQLHSDRKDTSSPLLDQPGCQMRLIISELVATDTIITDINSDVNISLLFSESL